MEDIVIVSAARTAVGKFGGSLAKVPATELGSIAIRAALERAKVCLLYTPPSPRDATLTRMPTSV